MNGKLLGIDYGARFIGLAITDETRQFVFGRGVIKVDAHKGFKPVLERIRESVIKEKITTIVLGLPWNEAGQETQQTKKIRAFAEKIRAFLPDREIVFADESFSSFEADRLLAESPLKASAKKEMQHEFAAILILKKFLNIS